MLLQEPDHSPYDIRFEIFGFPVRIAWTFWLGAAIFGYGVADGVDYLFGQESPGRLPLLLLWAACLLVSILIHELGHTFAFRFYGIESEVLLYHFGGLAIPRGTMRGGRFEFGGSMRFSATQDLVIAAAGPAAQLASAIIVIAMFKLGGYAVEAFNWMPKWMEIPWLTEGKPITSVGLYAIGVSLILPGVLWAFFNLLPVYPLDGGRIARSLIQLGGGNVEQSLWLSLITAVLVAFYGFNHGQFFLAFFFASFAINNWQQLQHYGGRF